MQEKLRGLVFVTESGSITRAQVRVTFDNNIDLIIKSMANNLYLQKELRRVYEQLQTLKVKVMRYENPHLQGKRGHSKSKLPFYKQISKHGAKKSGRGSAADVSEEAELEPLNTPQISSTANDKNSSSHAKETNQLSF